MGYKEGGDIEEDPSTKNEGSFKEKIQRQFIEANRHLHDI